jgi:Tol biopolymer transport system component
MRTRSLLSAVIFLVTFAAGAHAQTVYTPWSEPVNLGAIVNTSVSDFFPSVSKDGLSLYFTSPGDINRPSLGGMDIYVSRRPSLDAPWGPPENVGEPINSPYDDVSPMLTIDGHRMYFASNRPGGYGGNDIYVSRRHNKRDDFEWSVPRNVGEGVNTPANEAGPFLFEDDRTGTITLYFDSNRPDGPGPYTEDAVHNGNDIYTSVLQADETFGPAALVEELSTAWADRKPALRPDGLELILTSDRPDRLGVIDLWVSTRESTGDPWSAPTNMGPTINGPGNQSGAAFSLDGRTLYFNASKSSRPGFGNYDLFFTMRSRVPDSGSE